MKNQTAPYRRDITSTKEKPFVVLNMSALSMLEMQPFKLAPIKYKLALEIVSEYATGKKFRYLQQRKTAYELEIDSELYVVYLFDSGSAEIRRGSDLQ